MDSEALRRLAAELREQAAQEEQARNVKCAHLLVAARAVGLLREKVKRNG